MVFETNDSSFQKDVLESDLPAIVDFWAPWCGPCRIVSPILERVGDKTPGKVKVFKLNVDENPVISEKFGITGIPTVIFFNNGRIIKEFVGVQPEQVYINTISALQPVT